MNKGCAISAAVILAILSLGLGYYFYKQSVKDPKIYKTTQATIQNIAKKTVATGSVKPRQEVNIVPQVSGVIQKLYIEAGQIVKQGDRLAKIKLIPSQVNINNAQSSVEITKIRFQEAQRELQRQQQVFDKNLDINTQKANLQDAERNLQRQKSLLESGVVSQQEFDQAQLQYDLIKTQFDNASISAQNNIKQFKTNLDIRKQEYDAAVNNLQLLKEGASKKSRQVANIVVSTVNGMVLDVPLEEGASVIERNNFNEGTTIATVADMTKLIFEGLVDESDVGKLKEGMPLVLTIGAIDDKKFDAALEYISPKGIDDEGTIKFEIRADIKPNEATFLRAGYSANADIILDQKQNVLSIKERDVLFEEDTTYVEIKISNQEFEKKLISLGISDGINVEIKSGLDTTNLIKIQQ